MAQMKKPMTPAQKAKIKSMFPKVTAAEAAKQALVNPKKPMPKVIVKPKPLTGPAAVAELQRQVSPKGVKKSEMKQKQAIDKKYPGLYKKSK